MTTRTRTATLCISGLMGVVTTAGAQSSNPTVVTDDDIRAALRVNHVQRASLTLPAEDGTETFRAVIDLPDGPLTFDFVRRASRADDFKLLVDRGQGRIDAVDPGPDRTYGGAALEQSHVRARVTLRGGQISGIVDTGNELLYIQPLGRVFDDAAPAEHVVFRAADVLLSGGTCGNEPQPSAGGVLPEPAGVPGAGSPDPDEGDAPEGGSDAPAVITIPLPTPPNGVIGGHYRSYVAFDADYEFFIHEGGTVQGVVSAVDDLWPALEYAYETQTGICLALSALVVRTTSNDPYTTAYASGLLEEVEAWWTVYNASINRDLVHLLTAKDVYAYNPNNEITYSTVGVAYTNDWSINCDRDGFGLCEGVDSLANVVECIAHEMGHNWNACHCNQESCTGMPDTGACGIMTSSITGSNTFSAFSIGQIVSQRDLVAACPGDGPVDACGCGEVWTYDSDAGVGLDELVAESDCGTEIYIYSGAYVIESHALQPASGHSVTLYPVAGGVILDAP